MVNGKRLVAARGVQTEKVSGYDVWQLNVNECERS
jgi:hypothetical protein